VSAFATAGAYTNADTLVVVLAESHLPCRPS
jgi:hypothetical protein